MAGVLKNIQEQMMGVERKTPLYNMLIKQFSDAVDAEDYETGKKIYIKKLTGNDTSGESGKKDYEVRHGDD